MRRTLAKTKSEKCKYKRCLGKRKFPVDKPKYCGKHVDKLEYSVPIAIAQFPFHAPMAHSRITLTGSTGTVVEYPVPTKFQPKPSFFKKIKKFIFVSE